MPLEKCQEKDVLEFWGLDTVSCRADNLASSCCAWATADWPWVRGIRVSETQIQRAKIDWGRICIIRSQSSHSPCKATLSFCCRLLQWTILRDWMWTLGHGHELEIRWLWQKPVLLHKLLLWASGKDGKQEADKLTAECLNTVTELQGWQWGQYHRSTVDRVVSINMKNKVLRQIQCLSCVDFASLSWFCIPRHKS